MCSNVIAAPQQYARATHKKQELLTYLADAAG